jgi:hypothetical protein
MKAEAADAGLRLKLEDVVEDAEEDATDSWLRLSVRSLSLRINPY